MFDVDKIFYFFTLNEAALPYLPIIVDNIVRLHLHGDPLQFEGGLTRCV